MQRQEWSENVPRDRGVSPSLHLLESTKLEKEDEKSAETSDQPEEITKKRPLKRKRSITISDKINILYQLEEGISPCEITRQYGITKSAISKIKRKKVEYLSRTSNEVSMQQKNLRVTKNPVLEDMIYAWLCQQICLGEEISGPILCEKALILNEKMNGPSTFKASNGWLHRFKRRHGIRHLAFPGDKNPLDTEPSEQFVTDFKKYINFHRYESFNIYNADETGLNWKSLPERMVSSKKQISENNKEDRVTALFCANAAGTHKIPALIVGNEKKYKWFGNVTCLPVIYKDRANLLMDRSLFIDWYTNYFIPAVREEQEKSGNKGKVLLLLDNAACHSSAPILNSIDENFTVMYLPPTVTSILQPMNQGIIESVKNHYRKTLTIRLLLSQKFGVDQFIDSLTIKDCCEMIASSWHSVSPALLSKTWELLLPEKLFVLQRELEHADTVTPEELVSTLNQVNDFEVNESDVVAWLYEDSHDHGWAPLTDEQLIAETRRPETVTVSMNIKCEPHCEIEEEDENCTAENALNAINIVYKWYEKQQACSLDDLIILNKIRNTAMEKVIEEK